MKRFISTLIMLALAVGAGFCLREFVITFTRVEGASMGDTLKSGDIALVTQFDYNDSAPARGDVVRLEFPGREGAYIKRVVGLPGEQISIARGRVFIDGAPLDEPYAVGMGGDCALTLGADEFFVLGDDRDASYDSREEDIGAVGADSFRGRVRGVVWPLSRFKLGIE